MIIPIVYPSAGEFWLTNNELKKEKYSLFDRSLTCIPGKFDLNVRFSDANEISKKMHLSLPLHVCSLDLRDKQVRKKLVVHSRVKEFPPNTFIRCPISDYDIYISSPEFCFLQAASILDDIGLIRFGFDLCAQYEKNDGGKYGQTGRDIITSKESILSFLDSMSGEYGVKKARQAVQNVLNNSNSPMESKLAMIMSLPIKKGGFGIKGLEMNRTIKISEKGQLISGYSTLRSDIVHEESKVAIEYNSDLCHLKSEELTRDISRNKAIEASGYKLFTITAGNLRNYQFFENNIMYLRMRMKMPDVTDLFEIHRETRKRLITRLFFQNES